MNEVTVRARADDGEMVRAELACAEVLAAAEPTGPEKRLVALLALLAEVGLVKVPLRAPVEVFAPVPVREVTGLPGLVPLPVVTGVLPSVEGALAGPESGGRFAVGLLGSTGALFVPLFVGPAALAGAGWTPAHSVSPTCCADSSSSGLQLSWRQLWNALMNSGCWQYTWTSFWPYQRAPSCNLACVHKAAQPVAGTPGGVAGGATGVAVSLTAARADARQLRITKENRLERPVSMAGGNGKGKGVSSSSGEGGLRRGPKRSDKVSERADCKATTDGARKSLRLEWRVIWNAC